MASNKTVNQGFEGTYLASVALLYGQRVKFVSGTSSDGKPSLAIAGLADVADGVCQQNIASGAYGTIRFLNAPGEQIGIASGAIALGATVYSAASGAISTTSTSAVLVGKATSVGTDTNLVTYIKSS